MTRKVKDMKTRVWLQLLAGLSVMAVAAPAGAATRSERDVLEDMAICSDIADEAERLRCFDNVMPKVRAALGRAAEEGDAISLFGLTLWEDSDGDGQADADDGEPTRPEDFGIENVPAENRPDAETRTTEADTDDRLEVITSIKANIVETLTARDGSYVFVLDNGQIWRQTDADRVFKSRRDTVAIIETGFLGSYRMHFEGKNQTFTVRRIK